jgi:hypothetical protein
MLLLPFNSDNPSHHKFIKMKTTQSFKTGLILILSALIITSCTRGLSQEKVPIAVRSAFAKIYPTAKKVKWDAEDGNFEAEFKLGDKEISATYLPNAELYEVELEASEKNLPSLVKVAIYKDYGAEIKYSELEMLERSGTTSYEIEFKAKGKKHELHYSDQGETL